MSNQSEKGCIDCKHKISEYEQPRKCDKGHTVLLNEWFTENGKRTRDDGFINNHKCFEPHEVNVFLDKAIKATKEMLAKMKE